MAVAMCGKCKKFISLSAIPGGNPIARMQPGMFATSYAKCAHCGGLFCDGCIRSNNGKCLSCGVEVMIAGEKIVPSVKNINEIASRAVDGEKKKDPKAGTTCTRCGVENKDANTFCTGCGERLIKGPPAVDQVDQTVAAQPDVTILTEPQIPPDEAKPLETKLADSDAVSPARIEKKEQAVPDVWKVGDVILDLYEVKDLLGEGGFGRVYKVYHKGWNIDLAVKSPRSDRFKSDAERENFVRECETWINLGVHPNIVSCHYVRSINGVPNVFAEYVEGGSLHDWIEDRRLYEGGKEEVIKRILDISIQFTWGLNYAHTHEKGLIHQDVKPANVLITPEGEAKVTDFGLARARAVTEGVASESGAIGTIMVASGGMTPAYCSPEQAEGKPLSRKTDIWSWALSVLEMFTGERTWSSGTLAAVALDEYLKNGSSDDSIPRMPDVLAKLLNNCFERDPANRPNEFHEIVNNLLSIYKEECKFGEYPREEPEMVELLADGLNNRALSMLDLRKTEVAERLFDQALRADPHHPEATYNRGLFHWRAGRITDDDLVRQLEEVRTSDPESWRVEYLIGLVHLERGDVRSTFSALEAAKNKGGNAIEIETARNRGEAIKDDSTRIVSEIPMDDHVIGLIVNQDGRFAMTFESKHARAHVWELAEVRRVATLEGSGTRYTAGAISRDGCFALTAFSGDGSPRITSEGQVIDGSTFGVWEVATGKHLLSLHTGTILPVKALEFVGNGRYALAASGTILQLWDLETGEIVRSFPEKGRGAIECLSVSDDGITAVSVTIGGDVHIWNVPEGRYVRTIEARVGPFVTINHNGRILMSAVGLVQLWDVETGKRLRTFGVKGNIWNWARWLDRRFLICGTHNRVDVLDTTTMKCCHSLDYPHAKSPVAVVPDGKTVLTAHKDWKGIRIWRIGNFKEQPYSICQPRSTSRLASENRRKRDLIAHAEAALWEGRVAESFSAVRDAMSIPGFARDAALLRLRAQAGLRGRISGFFDGWCAHVIPCGDYFVSALAQTKDERLLATGYTAGNHVDIWEISTGRHVSRFEGHKMPVNCIGIEPNNEFAISCDLGGSLLRWNLATGEYAGKFPHNLLEGRCLAVSPDGNLVAFSGRHKRIAFDHIIPVFNIATGENLFIIKSEGYHPDCMSFTPDTRYLVTASHGHVLRYWDMYRRQCMHVLDNGDKDINGVSFATDGRFLLSASEFQSPSTRWILRLWDLYKKALVHTVDMGSLRVISCTHSPDGKYAITSSADHSVRLWDLSRGECVRALKAPTRGSGVIGISADAGFVFSGSARWQLVWDYDFPPASVWDEGARPYLEMFLSFHCPYAGDVIGREGRPAWSEEDFKSLVEELQHRGYGWLRPEGVRRELDKMAADWKGPPPLPDE